MIVPACAVAACSAIALYLCMWIRFVHRDTPILPAVTIFNADILFDLVPHSHQRLEILGPPVLKLSALFTLLRQVRSRDRIMGVPDAMCAMLLCFVVSRNSLLLFHELGPVLHAWHGADITPT